MNLQVLAVVFVRVLGLSLLLSSFAWGGSLLGPIVGLLLGLALLRRPQWLEKVLAKEADLGPPIPSRSLLRVMFALLALVLLVRSATRLVSDGVTNLPHGTGINGLLNALGGGYGDLFMWERVSFAPFLYLLSGLALFLAAAWLARVVLPEQMLARDEASRELLPRVLQCEVKLLAFLASAYGVWALTMAAVRLAHFPPSGRLVFRLMHLDSDASGGLYIGDRGSLIALATIVLGVGLLLASSKIASFWGWLHADSTPA